MPLVSVIMPSYNHERFVSEAIESILNQKMVDLELIIIDDASKDNSRNIVENYRKKDARIKFKIHEKNMGIARTMNDGISMATGKYIAFTASDDLWTPDKLEKQLKILEICEDLVVWSDGEVIDISGKPTGELFTQWLKASARIKNGDIFEEILMGNFVCGQGRILKRENLGNTRFNDALKYLNDYQLEVDLASRYNYYFMPEPLVKYRIHGHNSHTSDRDNWEKDNLIISNYFLDAYVGKMKRKTKSKLLGRIGMIQYNSNNSDTSRIFLYQAIKANPFDIYNLVYATLIFTSKGGVAQEFLKRLYKKYRYAKRKLINI